MVITVPATSANLGPGFDTLGLALNLRNEIEVIPSKSLEVEIYGENADFLKKLPRNYFIEIFSEHYKYLTDKEPKFKFKFNNKIPLSRGLGSSSAVIIAAITAAYEMAQVPYKKDRIINLALNYEPHPDNITPAALGGFCVAKLRKNRVYFLKKFIPTYLRAIIVIPNRPITSRYVSPSRITFLPLTFILSALKSSFSSFS
jgi:homoserine kinase